MNALVISRTDSRRSRPGARTRDRRGDSRRAAHGRAGYDAGRGEGAGDEHHHDTTKKNLFILDTKVL